MTDPRFFGFGSLVNATTHHYEIKPETLNGWSRIWVATPDRPYVYLSATKHAETAIAGVTAQVPGGNWLALDKRETGYERVDISDDIGLADVALYQVQPTAGFSGGQDSAILLSYLDVVIQGYLALCGEAGVADFFDTTLSWDRPILNDRAAPIYPRNQILTRQETALVDHHLNQLSA